MKNSTGHDEIPYIFIKQLPISAISILLKIYNLIWEKRTFLSSWKIAIIIPILKSNKIDTIDALTIITEDIYSAFNIKQHVLLTSLDIEKAYDMVWRHRILDILQKIKLMTIH